VAARTRNQMAPISTGPPKYTLSLSRLRRVSSGKSCGTLIRVGLLTTMPTGAGPRLFITSTTEFAKSSSGKSALPTMRIAVRCPESSAEIGDDAPNSSRSAQSVPAMPRCSQKRIFAGDATFITRHQGAFARCYALGALGAPATPRRISAAFCRRRMPYAEIAAPTSPRRWQRAEPSRSRLIAAAPSPCPD
jgi:hypothetical protein